MARPIAAVKGFSGLVWRLLGEGLRLFERGEKQSLPQWLASCVLLALVVAPCMVIGVALYVALAAILAVIALSFVYVVVSAILNGGPLSQEIPDGCVLLGVVIVLAAFMEIEGRVWLMTVGSFLAIGALLL
jgi:hypothetical protein